MLYIVQPYSRVRMATEVAVTLAKLQGRVGPMSAVYKVEMYKVPLTPKSLWNQKDFCWSMEKKYNLSGYVFSHIRWNPFGMTWFHKALVHMIVT